MLSRVLTVKIRVLQLHLVRLSNLIWPMLLLRRAQFQTPSSVSLLKEVGTKYLFGVNEIAPNYSRNLGLYLWALKKTAKLSSRFPGKENQAIRKMQSSSLFVGLIF